jgi:hypothetical protein
LPESQAPVMAHLAQALNVSTDELLGVKKGVRTSQAKKAAANHEDPEIRRVWKKFQQLLTLPEKDQRAVIRLVNSLVAARSNGNA